MRRNRNKSKCDLCAEVVVDPTSHKIYKHSEAVECQVCFKTYPSKYNLHEHVRNSHHGSKVGDKKVRSLNANINHFSFKGEYSFISLMNYHISS